MTTKEKILQDLAAAKKATVKNIENLETLLKEFSTIGVIKIFLKDENTIERIELPKGLSHQIFNLKEGSIGQAHNYPKLVKEI